MKKSKKWVLIGGAVVVVVVIYVLLQGKGNSSMSYDTLVVTRGPLNCTVTATGTVEPITKVTVGTQVSGPIARIYVDYNDEVKQGQLLAELDRTLLKSDLDARRASMESARSEYDFQLKNYTRVEGLHKKQLMSDTDYETALYQYEKAKNTYDQTLSEMTRAETNLSYASIYSPIDGVVLSRAVDEGQTVAASFNTPILFTIARDLRKMRVIADVDEADIGRVEKGQRVVFTVDAFPDNYFEGFVTQVRLEPTVTSNVVTYKVVIDAPNPDLKLKPGLTANITIYTLEREGVLVVPPKAFRFVPEEGAKNVVSQPDSTKDSSQAAKKGGSVQPVKIEGRLTSNRLDSLKQVEILMEHRKHVWVMQGGKMHRVPVATGISDGINTEVINGLQEGDTVVLGGHYESKLGGQKTRLMPGESKKRTK